MQHRYYERNSIKMHYVEAGSGPLVVLCHGFPECWYSWRSQIAALAAAGFRVIAPDQRGYGRTSAPDSIDAYSLPYLAGDIVSLVRHLGPAPAAIIGHDWGAPVAWTCALLRPDLFPALGLLSVPFLPKLFGGPKPTDGMRKMCGDSLMFYQLYFQEPGAAEPELESNARDALARIFVGASANRDPNNRALMLFPRGQRWIDTFPSPQTLPSWISAADLDLFAAEFEHSGFRGPLNWYRNLDRNAEILAFLAGRLVEQPSIFIAGELDAVLKMYPDAYETLEQTMPRLTRKVLIPQAGHWVQQEQANAVNALLIDFLRAQADSLAPSST